MIRAARLGWREAGGDRQPYSLDHDDIYHAADGVRETHRVFLDPLGFEERLADCRRERRALVLGEIGFGTGLNWAVAAGRALAAGVALHWVSVERAPLATDDFTRLAGQRSADCPAYAQLQAQYPPLLEGWHRRRLASGRLLLSLFWGEALAGLQPLAAERSLAVDGWLLDGFAPDRNPEAWSGELFAVLARLSRSRAGVATFTSAGRVRRALGDAGFHVERIDQRPHKRESLAGAFDRPAPPPPRPAASVTVVGSGLAGASTARQLAEAGCRVRVLEAAPAAPGGASALPEAVLHARLLPPPPAEAGVAARATAELRALAFLHAAAWQAGFDGAIETPAAGVLQLPGGTLSADRLEAVARHYLPTGRWLSALEADAASDLAGVPVPGPALHFHDACTLSPPRFCAALLDHPAIELRCGVRFTQAELAAAGEPVVLACGAAVTAFAAAEALEVVPVAGQVEFVDLLTPPRLALVGNGYRVPRPAGALGNTTLGASYEHRPWPADEARRHNLAQLDGSASTWRGSARGERAVSSDRVPVAGALCDADGQPVAGLYVNAGHGSAGTVTAPLGATLITAALGGPFAPLAPELRALFEPDRFRQRRLRRGPRHGTPA